MTNADDRRLRDLGNVALTRPLQTPLLAVPTEVELEGQDILWRDHEFKEVRPGVGMLEQFIELYSRSDSAILEYVRKWGPLGFCRHGLPASHGDGFCRNLFYSATQSVFCCPMATKGGQFDGWFMDPIADWRKFSRAAESILNVAAELNLGRVADFDEWQCIIPPTLPAPKLSMARARLADVMQDWLVS